MKNTTTLAAMAIAVGLAGALPAASLAQSAAPAVDRAGPPGPDERMMRERPSPEQMAEHRAQRLRAVLQLRPEQEGALKQFISSTQPDQRAWMQRRAERGQMREMTTPQRLAERRERMNQMMAAFDRRAEATTRFYGQLSPAQKQAFDAMGPMGGRGGEGGFHGGHGPMMGGWRG